MQRAPMNLWVMHTLELKLLRRNAINDKQHPSSSATRPNKRTKTSNSEVDGLIGAFTSSSNRLATTIEKLAQGNMDLSNDLYDMMKTLIDFNSAHISFYYSYLVTNPHIGKAFYNLPFDIKMDWWWSSLLSNSQKTNINNYVMRMTFVWY
jgi:hypothetical protein